MDIKRNQILAIAFGGLVTGVIVYVFDRQPEFIYFLPDRFSVNSVQGSIFGHVMTIYLSMVLGRFMFEGIVVLFIKFKKMILGI